MLSVSLWIKCWCMRIANHCILFLFTFYTTSLLFQNWGYRSCSMKTLFSLRILVEFLRVWKVTTSFGPPLYLCLSPLTWLARYACSLHILIMRRLRWKRDISRINHERLKLGQDCKGTEISQCILYSDAKYLPYTKKDGPLPYVPQPIIILIIVVIVIIIIKWSFLLLHGDAC